MDTPPAEVIKFAGPAVIFGIALMIMGIKKFQNARKIKDTPRSKISSAPQGYVEFEGFAWPQSTTTKLASGLEAVHYSLLIERQDTEGSGKKKRKVWRTVYQKTETHPFYIMDATGIAGFNLENSQIELDKHLVRSWTRLSPQERKLIMEKTSSSSISGFPPSTFLFGLFSKKFRVTENEIFAGSPLYVHGNFKTQTVQEAPLLAPGASEFYDRVFDLKKRAAKNLKHIFDKNRDGKLSHKELHDGYSLLATTALRKKTPPPEAFSLHEFGQLSSNETHKLLIADTTEEHLVGRLKRSGYLSFFGGSLAIAFGLFFIFPQVFLFHDNQNFANHYKISKNAPPLIAAQKSTPPERRPSATESPQDLHAKCLQNKRISCEKLLASQKKFKLTQEQINYYTHQITHLPVQ